MTLLLHAASPTTALLLLAATEAGLLPASSDRVLAYDSRKAGGRALASALGTGLPLPATDTAIDFAHRSDAAAVMRSLGPSEVVLDASSPRTAERLANAVGSARLRLLDDGTGLACATPDEFSPRTARRIDELLLPELVPGLLPVRLRETGTAVSPVPFDAVESVAGSWAVAAPVPPRLGVLLGREPRIALVLGRGLPELGGNILKETQRLAERTVAAALNAGAQAVVLAPVPGTGPLTGDAGSAAGGSGVPGGARSAALALCAAANAAGLAFASVPESLPALAAQRLVDPFLTLSVDDPLLLGLRTQRSVRTRSVATGRFLPRLRSPRDGARPHLSLVDAVMRRGVPVPAEEPSPRGVLQSLVDAVAYSVQPERLALLADDALRTLEHEPALRDAYVPRSRRTALRKEAARRGAQEPPTPARNGSGSRRNTGGKRQAKPLAWLHRAGRGA